MINRVVTKNLLHRPLRSTLTVLAIGMEVALILLIWGTTEGLIQESNRRKQGVGADILIRPSTSEGATSLGRADLTSDLVEKIEALPEVDVVVGTVVQMQANVTTVTGVDLEKFTRMAGGIRYIEGGPFESKFDILVDHGYARHNELEVGDAVTVMNRDFRLAGIIEEGKLSRIFIPLETMQELTGEQGKLSQVYVKLENSGQTEKMIAELKQMLPTHPVYSMEEFISLFTTQSKSMADDFIMVIVGIAIAVGFIVVLLAMYTAVLDRTREVGILKALGASEAYIARIFVLEAVGLTVVGIVLGIGLAHAAQQVIDARFPLIVIRFLDSHIFWAAVISVVGSILGTLYPASRAARQDALEALAYE